MLAGISRIIDTSSQQSKGENMISDNEFLEDYNEAEPNDEDN